MRINVTLYFLNLLKVDSCYAKLRKCAQILTSCFAKSPKFDFVNFKNSLLYINGKFHNTKTNLYAATLPGVSGFFLSKGNETAEKRHVNTLVVYNAFKISFTFWGKETPNKRKL